jgi:NitT/TauT family transport system substrate-binding protein
MEKTARILMLLAVAAILLAVLSGCGGGEKQRAQETAAGIPEKDRDYVVNLGYYNCDHMTAACIAKDTGIFDELGLKV